MASSIRESAVFIQERICSQVKELHYYKESSHGLLLDQERERIYADITGFILSLEVAYYGVKESGTAIEKAWLNNNKKVKMSMIKENEIVSLMQEEAYKPMSYKELEKHFGIGSANEFKDFIKMLNQLEESGHIVRSPNDRYGVPERMNLVRGKLQAHAKGFAFLHS